MNSPKMRKGRGRASLQEFLEEEVPKAKVENSVQNEESGVRSHIKHDSAFKIRFETLPLRDVRLNYKNKRLITQMVRFIPDEIIDAYDENDGLSMEDFIKSKVNEIPINKIIHQHHVASGLIKGSTRGGKHAVDNDVLNYPCHDDLYDLEEEGIFIGKGVCFSNINSSNDEVNNLIEAFVEKVKLTGESLAITEELTEIPAVFKTGAMHTLAYGHQRYCYLVYSLGLNEPYYFILKTNSEHQDRTIYLENNTKTSEGGYEQLLSFYFAAKDTNGSSDEIMKTLSIKRSYFFKIKPFIDDIRLINVVKQYGIHQSLHHITEQYRIVKQALTALESSPSKDKILKAFEEKMRYESSTADESSEQTIDVEQPKKETKPKSKSYLPIKIPKDEDKVQKLFFQDVREWSELDIDDFDLKSDKGLKKYLAALVDELSE
ncbi:hypothetical protein [Alteromonas sp. BZK5]|uniref:hypothetical protein n=1 Tax=Alteromonas sp. BZK5 TaxID=1904459 RepID=UPI001653D2D2|nr:hypothetical protein [Alteromonas sp. BZK5]MBC6987867.1 hypothetical protein [Alteromonas sp. BZK5]